MLTPDSLRNRRNSELNSLSCDDPQGLVRPGCELANYQGGLVRPVRTGSELAGGRLRSSGGPVRYFAYFAPVQNRCTGCEPATTAGQAAPDHHQKPTVAVTRSNEPRRWG